LRWGREGRNGEGREEDGLREVVLELNQSLRMTSLRTVSPNIAIFSFPSEMLRVPIRSTLYDSEVSTSLLDNISRVRESVLPVAFCLEGFPEEIGIGESVSQYRLQLNTVVGIHER
jgi:hypothetical protein